MPIRRPARLRLEPRQPQVTPFEHWRGGVQTNHKSGRTPVDALELADDSQLTDDAALTDRWHLYPIQLDKRTRDSIQDLHGGFPNKHIEVFSFYNQDPNFSDDEGYYWLFVDRGNIYSTIPIKGGVADQSTNPLNNNDGDPVFWRQYFRASYRNWKQAIPLGPGVLLLYDGSDTNPMGIWDPIVSDTIIPLAKIKNTPTISVSVPDGLKPGDNDDVYPYFVGATFYGDNWPEAVGERPYNLGETDLSELFSFTTNRPAEEWTDDLKPTITLSGDPMSDELGGTLVDKAEVLGFFERRAYFGSRTDELYLLGETTGRWWETVNPLVSPSETNNTCDVRGVSAASIVGERLIVGGNAKCWYDIKARRMRFDETASSGTFDVGVDGDRVVAIVEEPGSPGGLLSLLVFTDNLASTKPKVFRAVEDKVDYEGPYTQFNVDLLRGVEGTLRSESIVVDRGEIHWLARSGFKKMGPNGYEDISGDIRGDVRARANSLGSVGTAPGLAEDGKIFWQLPTSANISGPNDIFVYYNEDNRGAWMRSWRINSRNFFAGFHPWAGRNLNIVGDVGVFVELGDVAKSRLHQLLPDYQDGCLFHSTDVRTGQMLFNRLPELSSHVETVRFEFSKIMGRVTLSVYGKTNDGRTGLLATKTFVVRLNDGIRKTENVTVYVRVSRICQWVKATVKTEPLRELYGNQLIDIPGFTIPGGQRLHGGEQTGPSYYALTGIYVVHYPIGVSRSTRGEREAIEPIN